MAGYHTKRIANPRYVGLTKALLKTAKALNLLPDRALSVADFGCSCGAFLKEFSSQRECKSLLGFDHSREAESLFDVPLGKFIRADLNQKLQWPEEFKADLIVSTEVAEHLKNGDNLIDTISDQFGSSDEALLWFSAALPHQKGRGHINCQTLGYWIKAFEGEGWCYQARATNEFSYWQGVFGKEHKIPSYYLNSLLFKRQSFADRLTC